MKRAILLTIALVAVVGLAIFARSLPQILTSRPVNWQCIESVGGMKVILEEDGLQVRCDVSGTKAVTKKPTLENSALGVRKLRSSRDGKVVRLSVVTTAMGKGISTQCPDVDVSSWPAGVYQVIYVDPDGTEHLVGEVTRS